MLVNDLIRSSGDIDIYVVSGEDEAAAPMRPTLPTNPAPSRWTSYAWALAVVAAYDGHPYVGL